MKTSTLIPVVAYLGLAGYTVAAPVDIEATHSLDKRTFCFFGFGWCNTATTTSTAPKSTASSVAPSSSVKAVVTSSSAVKASAVASSSAKVVSSAAAASSAKVVSSAAASSSAKAVVSTSAAVTKTSTANWAQCTDFDWNSWGSDWTWGGGFDKEYVKSWYVAEYGFAPPQGMNWRQVSSLVSKFGQKTKPASPKTTSKYTGKGCANPWTSAVNTKTAAVTSSAKPAVTSAAASKPAATSAAASSAAVSKASSAAASSASASVAKPSASSASSVVVGGPASSAASSAAASSAAASSSAASSAAASSAAASSVAASSAAASPAASSAASSAAAPAASSAASSAVVESAPAASSAAAVATTVESSPSPAASSSASAAAASPSAGTGSSDGSVGVPGTGSGVPGTGAGSNNATGTATSEAPVATTPAAVVINGFTSGGCVQEVSGRLLEKVQTSSSSQTIESCTALCASYGFGVAGLEYGNECYCGVQEDLEGALVSGECYMPCAGDSSEICGGPNALNVYVNPDITPRTVQLPAGWTTYGVVSEGQNGRLLPVQLYSSADNTNAKCANDCAAQGYSISGTEYSSECFCGNAFSSAANGGELLDDSAAFMKCAGDLAESCGGPSILSISSAFGDNIPFA